MPGKALDQKVINTCTPALIRFPTLAREKCMLGYDSILLLWGDGLQMLIVLYFALWMIIIILFLLLLTLVDIRQDIEELKKESEK